MTKESGTSNKVMQELRLFEQQWTKNMGIYWRERMQKLRVIDTGALFGSVAGMLHPGPVTTIEHSFLVYGKYVSEGVGRNFRRSRDATGHIPFLLPGGEEYRQEHGLDKPKPIGKSWRRSRNSPGDASKREAGGRPTKYDPTSGEYKGRDWFYRKYYASRMVLNEFEAAAYGQAYQGMLTTGLDGLFGRLRYL